jgi:hypothetical protein
MALGSNRAERPSVEKQMILRDKIAQAGGYKDHADAIKKIKAEYSLLRKCSKKRK